MVSPVVSEGAAAAASVVISQSNERPTCLDGSYIGATGHCEELVHPPIYNGDVDHSGIGYLIGGTIVMALAIGMMTRR